MLETLHVELNLPFAGEYAARIGNFEIFELEDWLDGPRPFLIEGVQNGKGEVGGFPELMSIRRTQAFAQKEHMAHLVGRSAGDVVLDRIIRLPVNEQTVNVPVPERLDGIEIHIFDQSGERLIHHEKSNFITQIGFVLAMAGHRIVIDDELANKAKQGGGALATKASLVGSFSPQRSVVGAPPPGSWRSFVDNMRELVAARLPRPSEDRWFPKGIEGEVASIVHLAGLLDGGSIRAAILADPWFGAEALQRFAPPPGLGI